MSRAARNRLTVLSAILINEPWLSLFSYGQEIPNVTGRDPVACRAYRGG
jgi:hypothetical protein